MKLILALMITGVAFLCGCGDSAVSAVQDGTFNSRPQATIGDVFDANFDSCDWDSYKEGGKTKVKFTGEISEDLHEKAVNLVFGGMEARYLSVKYFDQEFKDATSKRGIKEIEAKNAADSAEIKKIKRRLELIKLTPKDMEYRVDRIKDNMVISKKRITWHEEVLNSEYASETSRIHAKDRMEYERDNVESCKAALAAIQSISQSTPEERAQAARDAQKRIDQLYKQIRQLDQKKGELRAKLKDVEAEERVKLLERVKEKKIWPEGSEVTFIWTLHADGIKFEINSFTNDSWAFLNHNLNSVLGVLYKD